MENRRAASAGRAPGTFPLVISYDEARADRPGNISRNTWITEAIQEKLLREGRRSKLQGGNADA